MDRLRVVVLGGGTAGWMTAAALQHLAGAACTVTLIESREIGIVGVGEASLPHLRAFVARLGIDEQAFLDATDATYKLGIEFCDFGQIGERYIHPFGTYGRPLGDVGFHHYWLRCHAQGHAHPIDAYSAGVVAAENGRFARPGDDADDPTGSYGYAYHFDATRLGPFLRDWAVARGVARIEGNVAAVEREAGGGDVKALNLSDGRSITGDLFVDCSGFRALLSGDEDASDWEDWSPWLPCDRAVAVPCAPRDEVREPFTRATAMPAGWRWRIPLRSRIGNGYVYSSADASDDEATAALLAVLEGAPLAEPRILRFRAGRRRRGWVGNVVAIGLASGFLEPLESTSIYLVQAAITVLIEHLPVGPVADIERDAFNAAMTWEYDRIRDFLILHYHATTRDDSPFWDHVRTMQVPETLTAKMALWSRTGHVAHYDRGLFLEPSWIAVYLGQGIVPTGWDPRADRAALPALDRALATLREAIAARVAAMPPHEAALRARQPSSAPA